MMKINRRKFITGSAAAGALTVLPQIHDAYAAVRADSYATIIDLNKCDGCIDKPNPLFEMACRERRGDSFPEPVQDQLLDYWPQNKHEV